MCEKEQSRRYDPSDNVTQARDMGLGVKQHSESYMLQELKYKREQLFIRLVYIQNAIDAVNRVE